MCAAFAQLLVDYGGKPDLRTRRVAKLRCASVDSTSPVPKYVQRGGCLYVVPYEIFRVLNVKERWSTEPIAQVLARELVGTSLEEWNTFFASGLIREWRGRDEEGAVRRDRHTSLSSFQLMPAVSPRAVLTQGTRLIHRYHAHERPVRFPTQVSTSDQRHQACGGIVSLLGINERAGVAAVTKLANVPVTPCGLYNYNSVLALLRVFVPELGSYNSPHPVHRLDGPVTGVCLFALSEKAASQLTEKFRARRIRKMYLAETAGFFDHEETVCDAPLSVQTQVDFISGRRHRIGVVDFQNGSHASTHIRRLLRYKTDHGEARSLLLVEPRTGRTHQIRCHLAHLGFPIVKDTRFEYKSARGPLPGVLPSATFEEETMSRETMHLELATGSALLCPHCPRLGVKDRSFANDASAIHLHAHRYWDIDGSLDFTAELPSWMSGFEESLEGRHL
ncbi:RNA pseudouridine synthase 7 [Porphyridium purpureum]|uniref:RNA pseudouridine synthase 7 n=1 Tax=Porphyridium purpureum TaxID=35688 RepID=A0A5J4YVB6_PORPP|nr:RNA pseudouridine synthase 7 [Porphyridium purpureum]|eukprot:POR2386..scf209_3